MLQISYIRENKDLVINGLKKRNFKELELVEEAISLDENRRLVQTKLDNALAESNKLSKEIGTLMKEGKKQEAEVAKAQTADLKEQIKQYSASLEETVNSLNDILYRIPNIPNALVPEGKTAEDNLTVFQAGEIPHLFEGALPHWELAKKYNIIDFELGVKLTGAGFPVYKDKGAKLQRALISYFLDKNTEAGYLEYQVPHMVNQDSGYGTGQLPDKEGQMYHVQIDNLYLIPTAEVPVTNIFRDVMLSESDLPIRCTAYTPCFRREAGSYGKDVRGLNRLHQFDKVEIVRIDTPEHSYQSWHEMLDHVEGLLKKLELPYHLLLLCGGDMSFTSSICVDFETYSAAQHRWLEVSSVSNFESYQANRLHCRYRHAEDKKIELCHTLNGSALALPRIVATILENNQTPQGIRVPKVLVPYCGFEYLDDKND